MARALIAIALVSLACTKEPAPAPSLGRRVAEGRVAAVRPSPDGAWLAWLDGCEPVAKGFVPRGTASCDLRVASVRAGPVEARTEGAAGARVLARGVTTLPQGLAWTPDGALLALAGYDHAAARGTLVLWRPGGEPRTLAADVSFHAAAPGNRVGWISRGALALLGPGDAPVEVAGATRLATFEWAPGGGASPLRLLARREAGAGGDLLALPASGALRTVAARAGDYRFSPRGDFAFTRREGEGEALAFVRASERAAPAPLRANVHAFSFSPRGDAVAFLADLAPGRQGDLWVARVDAAGPPERLANGVGDFRWAADAPRLAWLAEFDPGTRSGALAIGGPGEPAVELAKRVSAYDVSPDGSHVAFLEHVLTGGYSIDLKLAHLRAGEAPRVEEVARGAFGFELSPARDFLWYRTACTGNGDSCDLLRIPAAGGAPERIAGGVRSFEFDPRSGRVLVGFAREGAEIDVGLWNAGKLVRVDRGVVPGTAAFLDAGRVSYAVAEKGRAGVYVAEAR